MRNRITPLLGIGLFILWIAGLGASDSRILLAWLDCLGAVAAFSLLASVPAYERKQVQVEGHIVIAFGLFIFWVVGVLTPGPVWQAWWTFGFGCAFLLRGLALAVEKRPLAPGTAQRQAETEHDKEKMRWSA